MKTVWVVVMVTAVSPFNYNVSPLTDADTIKQCHQKAVQIDRDIERDDNQEMVCIKVDWE